VKSGATVSHHHGVGLMKREFTTLEYKGGDRIFYSLKEVFDPEGVMNPGKVYPSSTAKIERIEGKGTGLKEFMAAASYLFSLTPPNIVKIRVPEEVSEVLRFAARHNVRLAVQSEISQKEARSLGMLFLDLLDMDEILKLDPISGIVTVQAGIPVKHLEVFLNQKGYTLGLLVHNMMDLPVGTYVALGAEGMYSPLYGDIRDMVVGLSGILADGSDFRARPAPRRAVGPDMAGVFIGAKGSFGVITGLCLRVFPKPASIQYLAFGGDNPSLAASALRAAMCRGARPSDGFMIIRSPDRILQEGRVRLVLKFEGTSAFVTSQVELVKGILEAAGMEGQRVRKKVKDWRKWGKRMYDRFLSFSSLLDFIEELPVDPESRFPDVFITSFSRHGARVVVQKKDPTQQWPSGFGESYLRRRCLLKRELKKVLDPSCILNCREDAFSDR